ncbi:hypothetical protein PoB_004035100 [Plakobranchus ocellatus]|uniref:Uncharacterized protein n=1 Tax=Plakobranchus ocellatus TaxID=259542 RepID=A0AAV4B4V1_9GAST|nr:hypothetical protein PoB_004035100 [Plakobranchus ocellatus]
MEKVSSIGTSFKHMAIAIDGPINPTSEPGHRFILPLLDHATGYAQVVPPRKIDAETVAQTAFTAAWVFQSRYLVSRDSSCPTA